MSRVDWTNPHTYFFVEDNRGSAWRFEANATSILRRAGWQSDSVSVGDAVVVRANPARDPEILQGRMLSIAKIDGTVLSTSSRAIENNNAGMEPLSTDDLEGIWRGEPDQAIDLLFAYIDHPLTESGERAKAQFTESMDPITSCVTWPTPRFLAWTAFYLSAIEIADDEIVIRNEFGKTKRTIYMDGRDHPSDQVEVGQGHSIGWWEEGVLVVETTNFAPSRSPVAAGIPSGPEKVVEERFKLSEDGTQIHIEIEVRDSQYLAEPFRAQLTWHYSPNLDLSPFDCDPEIARRFLQ